MATPPNTPNAPASNIPDPYKAHAIIAGFRLIPTAPGGVGGAGGGGPAMVGMTLEGVGEAAGVTVGHLAIPLDSLSSLPLGCEVKILIDPHFGRRAFAKMAQGK